MKSWCLTHGSPESKPAGRCVAWLHDHPTPSKPCVFRGPKADGPHTERNSIAIEAAIRAGLDDHGPDDFRATKDDE